MNVTLMRRIHRELDSLQSFERVSNEFTLILHIPPNLHPGGKRSLMLHNQRSFAIC